MGAIGPHLPKSERPRKDPRPPQKCMGGCGALTIYAYCDECSSPHAAPYSVMADVRFQRTASCHASDLPRSVAGARRKRIVRCR